MRHAGPHDLPRRNAILADPTDLVGAPRRSAGTIAPPSGCSAKAEHQVAELTDDEIEAVSSDPVNPAVGAISVFFPCYNDEGTIAETVRIAVATIRKVGVCDAEVIVVNDGSTDGSAAVLAGLTADEPLLRVVTHDRNRGYGGALLSGFGAAKKQWVFYSDGDGQYDPAELELLVQHASEEVDVVQGYKIRRADGPVRAVIGRVYQRFVKFFFGLQIRDTDCDFRLIRHATLDEVELVHTTGVICVELVRKLQDVGARFTEVGVHHYRRVYGKSEFFRVGAIVRTLWGLAGLWIQLVVLRRSRYRHARSL
jgi:glycosyltransferase involved in cell wall biosynthesis